MFLRDRPLRAMLLRGVCVCVLAGILVAGLWPFHAPRNEVRWSKQGYGLSFGRHGSIVSSNSLAPANSAPDGPCSIEIWLQPARDNSSGSILAVSSPSNPVVPFVLSQSLGDLKLELGSPVQLGDRSRIYVNHVFIQLKPVFLTISSSPTGTAFYLDGAPVKQASDFKFSSHNLTGQLVLGNAPSSTDSWPGQIKGMALYDHALTASEVFEHFRAWSTGQIAKGQLAKGKIAEGKIARGKIARETTGTTPPAKDPTQIATAKIEGAIALYLFDEGAGNVVHNQVDPATDLVIPKRFFVLHEEFLERPWDEYHSGWRYWKNVAINIVGFIPLGFFFQAYFVTIAKFKRATWFTIALGFAASLTIEALQSFLPTRDSGMTDLFTNTLGTALGAISCNWSLKHHWFPGAGTLYSRGSEKEQLERKYDLEKQDNWFNTYSAP